MVDIDLPSPSNMPPLLVNIDDVMAALGGSSRSVVYQLIRQKDLEKVQIGRRSFVTFESLCAYVERLKASA